MNYTRPVRISRRHVLQGIGATMALPFMEAMGAPTKTSSLAVGPEGQPLRYAAIFMPNGALPEQFTPGGSTLDELPPMLQPLAGLKEHLNVITGLRNGMGGHSGSTPGFLTGQRPAKASDASEMNIGSASVDQIIGHAAKDTPLPTLELAMHAPRRGTSPSGLPWAYGNYISWRDPSTPVPQEVDPMRAFKRLFDSVGVTSEPSGSRKKSVAPTKGVVDTILEDAKQLQKRLGRADQQKLDEYLTTVRDVETRIMRKSQPKGMKITPEILADIKKTERRIKREGGGSGDSLSVLPDIPYPEYIQMMMDIMALAFWSNSTRSSTLMLGDGGSRRNMSFLDGVEGAHHSISHHGNRADTLKQYELINTFFMSQYAYFLERLHSMKEGSNSVLENSMIMMGSSISNGQNHNPGSLPILMGGHAGGKIKGNRHINGEGANIATLHSRVLDTMNIKDELQGKGGKLQQL
ncbi:DUF1552 domain-containing protein [Luteolibacter sp. AS25]|uniref:DUF1552 domain-containing protein n=1 Tax=Luteolibacter sp. AS25 TaxID=3135776 RepID=UPI00398B1855